MKSKSKPIKFDDVTAWMAGEADEKTRATIANDVQEAFGATRFHLARQADPYKHQLKPLKTRHDSESWDQWQWAAYYIRCKRRYRQKRTRIVYLLIIGLSTIGILLFLRGAAKYPVILRELADKIANVTIEYRIVVYMAMIVVGIFVLWKARTRL